MNWVLDADIRGFYDAMSHTWIIRFLEHCIADKRILRLVAKWLKVGIKCMHDPIAKTGAWVKQMLQGHLNYYAVSGNHPSLWWFCNQVRRLWLKSLRRRSQKAYLSWERFIRLVDRFFPPIKVLHPLPSPLRRQNPREEPGALAAPAGICAGGEKQSSFIAYRTTKASIRRNLNITLPWARVGQARFSYAGLRLSNEESTGRSGVLSGSIRPES